MTKASDRNIIPYNEQLQEAANLIRSIWNEGYCQSRLVIVETYHQIGQVILSLPERKQAVSDLTRMTSLSERTLYRAAQFFNKYPDYISQLPEGKQITWNKIVTKYLPDKKRADPCAEGHDWIEVCRHCGKKRDPQTDL